MNEQWVTLADAVSLAKRSKTTIYLWVKQQHVRARRGVNGVMEFYGPDILAAEAKIRRGRPVGTARPTGYPATRQYR